MAPTKLDQSLLNSRGTMTESLTGLRMRKLKEARDEFGFRNVGSTDGRILYKEEGSDQTRVYYK